MNQELKPAERLEIAERQLAKVLERITALESKPETEPATPAQSFTDTEIGQHILERLFAVEQMVQTDSIEGKNHALLDHAVAITVAMLNSRVLQANEVVGTVTANFTALKLLLSTDVVAAPAPPAARKAPAVKIKESVHDDYLICLEDGKKFKSLRRHLMADFGLTPEQYRQKWGLPIDYPMVAPAYAAKRSALAKEMGLGKKKAA